MRLASSDEAFAVSDLVLSGFLRIGTHPRIFSPPVPLAAAMACAAALRSVPAAVRLIPGARHWDSFKRLGAAAAARGNRIPAAWLVALAIESGSELITTDRDDARFAGLR